MRGMVSRTCVIGVVVLVAASLEASPPRYVRLSFSTPDATTTVGVAWTTDSESDPSVVEYGLDASYGQTAEGHAFRGSGPLAVIHEVTLVGLKPNTTYHYRAGGPGSWSPDSTFTTAPSDPCEPYRVVVLGDGRSDDNTGPSPRWDDIFEEVFEYDPRFILNTGDIVRDGSDTPQWDRWLAASQAELARAPHLPTMGNHDDGPGAGDTANYNQVFHLPRNDVTGTEDYYYVTTGDAIFVSLSTMEFTDGVIPFQKQADWLDRVLTENPRRWKVVFFHHPVYCSEDWFGLVHPPDEQGQNAALVPVFDKHHVDLVFYGHNHWYERIGPVRGQGGANEGVPVNSFEQGTVYVVTGGAGATAYNIVVNLFCPRTPGSKVCSGDHHFVILEFDGNRLAYTARATRAQLLGTNPANAKVIESFVIEKPLGGGQDPCGPVPQPDPGPEPVPDAGIADTPGPDEPAPADEPRWPDMQPPETVFVEPSAADAGGPSPDLGAADASAPGPEAQAPDAGPADRGGAKSGKSGGGCHAAVGVPAGLSWLLAGWLLGWIRLRKTRSERHHLHRPAPSRTR